MLHIFMRHQSLRASTSLGATTAVVVGVLLGACRSGVSSPAPAPAADSVRLAADVRFLSSDALEGRGTGTPGNDSAAAYIAARFAALRLTPVIPVDSACATNSAARRCPVGFLQRFAARSAAAAHAGLPASLPSSNVAAVIPGIDPKLRSQYVVLGAHFDHLGRSTFGAQDPDQRNAVRNGADDNASGTAAVMELARLFKSRPAKRSIVVVAFSGEELGLLGSQYFVDHAPLALDSVQAMLNFDMVGRLRDDKLLVYGVATATELPEIVNRANVTPPFRVSAIGDGFGPSDHSSFYGRNLPVLHFFTDVHEDYHRASDDAERINFGGLQRVVSYAERIARDLADRPERLTFVRAPVRATVGGSRTGPRPYLGTVPDMGTGDVVGLKLSGVSPGSPADSAGLEAGDVIVELGGTAVKDLYSYSEALYAKKPGETISIVVMRKGTRVSVQATLKSREQ
jgi:hypothetical protein